MRLSPEARKVLQELGRIGGQKGGKVRAERMTPEQRRDAARKAVRMRWARQRVTRSIQAYLEGVKELSWVLGVIKASGVPSDEIVETMEPLRTSRSDARWMALFRRVHPKP